MCIISCCTSTSLELFAMANEIETMISYIECSSGYQWNNEDILSFQEITALAATLQSLVETRRLILSDI